MEERLIMSNKEIDRYVIIKRVNNKEFTQVKAAELLTQLMLCTHSDLDCIFTIESKEQPDRPNEGNQALLGLASQFRAATYMLSDAGNQDGTDTVRPGRGRPGYLQL